MIYIVILVILGVVETVEKSHEPLFFKGLEVVEYLKRCEIEC